jgi:uncharacterized protein (DUF697 family)
MPFGFGVGQLVGLVRDARGLEQPRAIVIAGRDAQALATALSENGDPRAIAVNGDPDRPAAAIRLLDGAPTEADLAVLRRLARAGVPLIAVQRGSSSQIPYVLPHDVVDAPGGVIPVDRVARSLAAALPPGDAAALAARLPVLRGEVESRIVQRTALANAGMGAAPWLQEAHMPLMTLAQSRMLLELNVAAGNALPHKPQPLARAAGPAVAGSVATGLGLRAFYRRLPIRGPLVSAVLAYAGTYALGKLRRRI